MGTIAGSEPITTDRLGSEMIWPDNPVNSLKNPKSNELVNIVPKYSTDSHTQNNLSQDGTVEIMEARGQTYRHFRYQNITNKYLYQSDTLVQKPGVVEGTKWVNFDEYPVEFIVRFINGTLVSFSSSNEVEQFISECNHSQLWGVGVETYAGIMGFYLNFKDLKNGHGQYIYWPRLSDGAITPYNMPLYNIFPHLHTKQKGVWKDRILSDHSLYISPTQDPRNNLEFFTSGSQIGIQYLSPNVTIQGSIWDFIHGFKFNLSDGLFHMISTLQCHNQDFEDIGMTYEILSSPQAADTSYELAQFQLGNESHEVTLGISQAWEAGAYIKNYSSSVKIISQNNENFRFTFDDMRDAGFTKRSLQLYDQLLPGGSIRKALQTGMFNYGSFLAGERIEIDPTTGTRYSTDNYDLYLESTTYTTSSTALVVGLSGGQPESYNKKAFIAFNTGLEYEIGSIDSNSFRIYYGGTDSFESGEGISLRVYNVVGSGNGANSNTAKENSKSHSLGTNSLQNLVWGNGLSAGYHTGSTSKVDSLLEYWDTNRGNGENWISFRLEAYGADPFTEDKAGFVDSQYSGTSHDPKLSFTYTWAHPPNLDITTVSVNGSPPPEKGDNIQFKVTVYNSGTVPATDVRTRIKIKAGVDYPWGVYQ